MSKADSRGIVGTLARNRIPVGIGIVALVALVGYLTLFAGDGGISAGTTFIARRGDLDVTVTEGGAIQALESQEIVSAIKGQQGVKILELVDEGYLVTPEDVANGKVLVELDSADLKDRVVNQEIAYQSAEALYIEGKAQYDIQVNQNQSLITGAELKAKFALMDFEKYLGKKAVDAITTQLGLDKVSADLGALKDSGGHKVEMPDPVVVQPIVPIPGPNETSGVGEWPQRVREGGANGDGPPRDPAAQGDGNRRGGEGRRGQWEGRGGGQGGAGAGGFGGANPEGRARSGDQQGRPGGSGGGQGGPGGGGMDPERFKEMVEANGGKIPEQMAERIRQMGMDPDMILKQMGITPGDGVTKAETEAPSESTSLPPVTSAVFVKDEAYLKNRAGIDFTQFGKAAELEDGEARQQLRTFEDRILVAEQEHRLAQNSLDGKVRLADKQFITQNELDLEKVKVKKAEIQVESSNSDLRLYVQYTLVKTAEMLLSDYEEALSALEREMQQASAELAESDARLKSAEQKYNLEKSQWIDFKDQLSKTVIRAERPGLVVYGSSTENNMFRRGNEEPILEGTTVRERQKIITIPDMTKMGVKVNIHESAVQRILPGQPVRLRIDAFSDRPLTGKVDRVAPLADSANMFMNPDLKVYPTTIRIEGVYDWLRPGMSAEVEILTGTLKDVVYIPIQAVSYFGDTQVCYVVSNGVPTRRTVTTGSFTEDFIEIKSGLEEGEEVLLLAPDAGRQDQMNREQGEEEGAGEGAPAEGATKEAAPASA